MANSATLYAVAAGVASHVLYFNRFECHMHAVLYLQTFFAVYVASTATLVNGYGFLISDALRTTSVIAASFLAGAYSSLLVYRIFLNPLNRFPGPWGARLSNFYFSSQLTNNDAYLKLQALHKKYGPIVRIGSSDLSIIDPKGMDTTYGLNAKATKGASYDQEVPYSSMHTTRSKELHDRRRKVWAPAFSQKALLSYEATIDEYNDLMVRRIGESGSKPINITRWFNLYSFNVMGRMAFGKDYGMLESGQMHKKVQLLSDGMKPLGWLMPPWFFRMLISIPGLASDFAKFDRFCADELDWRVEHTGQIEKEGGRKDIMSWLLRAYQNVKKPQQDPLLRADTKLIIVAGVRQCIKLMG